MQAATSTTVATIDSGRSMRLGQRGCPAMHRHAQQHRQQHRGGDDAHDVGDRDVERALKRIAQQRRHQRHVRDRHQCGGGQQPHHVRLLAAGLDLLVGQDRRHRRHRRSEQRDHHRVVEVEPQRQREHEHRHHHQHRHQRAHQQARPPPQEQHVAEARVEGDAEDDQRHAELDREPDQMHGRHGGCPVLRLSRRAASPA
jgi:hypothetical protein